MVQLCVLLLDRAVGLACGLLALCVCFLFIVYKLAVTCLALLAWPVVCSWLCCSLLFVCCVS